MVTWTIPLESKEFVGGVTVLVNGIPVTPIELALVRFGRRPAEQDWKPPAVLQGKQGVLVGPGTSYPLGVGKYLLWARYLGATERPVLNDVGMVVII